MECSLAMVSVGRPGSHPDASAWVASSGDELFHENGEADGGGTFSCNLSTKWKVQEKVLGENYD
jgi:hypothetical protein